MALSGKPLEFSDCHVGDNVIVQSVESYYHGCYAKVIALHKEQNESICVHMQYSNHPTYFKPEELRKVN